MANHCVDGSVLLRRMLNTSQSAPYRRLVLHPRYQPFRDYGREVSE